MLKNLKGIAEFKKHSVVLYNICNNKIYYENLYERIVRVLCRALFKLTINDDDICFEIKIKTKDNELINIKKVCDRIKRLAIIRARKNNKQLEFEFQYAYDFLVESVIFAYDKFKTIHENRQKTKNNELFRIELIKNPQLFEDYILSVNLIMLLLGYSTHYRLLHNYKSIDATNGAIGTESTLSITYDRYTERYGETENDTLDIVIPLMFEYYKTNDFSSNQSIFINENMEKQREYLQKKMGKNCDFHKQHKMLFEAIAKCRSIQEKIPYFVKPNYYVNFYDKAYHYFFLPKQNYFNLKLNWEISQYKNLESDETQNIFKMDFDVFSMHTPQSIFSISKLVTILDAKIEYITRFANFYVDLSINRTKLSYKIAITEYFDKLIKKYNANINLVQRFIREKEMCINEIDAIKTPAQENMETDKIKKMMLYKSKDFHKKYYYEIYQPIFDRIETTINQINRNYSILYNGVEDVKRNLLKMIKNSSQTANYYENMVKILLMQQKLAKKYNKIESNGTETIRTVLENKYYKYCLSEASHNTLLNEQNKTLDKTNVTKAIDQITCDEIKLHEQDKKFICDNKYVISKIINSTMDMKRIISNAEKEAMELIELYNKRKH
ncbi:hypothetical protein BDAP_002714 [Binucleata daphniae]